MQTGSRDTSTHSFRFAEEGHWFLPAAVGVIGMGSAMGVGLTAAALGAPFGIVDFFSIISAFGALSVVLFFRHPFVPRDASRPAERTLQEALLTDLAAGVAAGLLSALTISAMGGLILDSSAERARDAAEELRERIEAEADGWALRMLDEWAAGPDFGTLNVLLIGLSVGLATALSGVSGRYLALLLCTRRRGERWLPWHLTRFMKRCYDAGLLRRAGGAFQFRHRELQDFLADSGLHMVDGQAGSARPLSS